jgi:hypothetical protein
MWTQERIAIGNKLNLAIEDSDLERVRSLCSEFPWLVTDYKWDGETTWIGTAAAVGHEQMVSLLLDLGYSPNALRLPEKSTALATAIGYEHEPVVTLLLKRGANPNLDRAIIGALNIKERDFQLRLLKLLIAKGVDVNQLFPLYGDWDKAFTPLDWVKPNSEEANLLRQHGAKTAQELSRLSDSSRNTE